MDVYQYICGTGLFALVFLHHAVLSVPINCLPEMVEVHLLSGHLFDSVFVNMSSEKHASADAKSHWLHLFDFSPLCVFKCVLKLLA